MSQISRQPAVDSLPRLVVADCVRGMGGGERFVLDLARHLPGRGWQVTVLAYPGAPLHRACVDEKLPVHTARTRANGAPWTVLPLMAWMRRHRVDLLLTEFDKVTREHVTDEELNRSKEWLVGSHTMKLQRNLSQAIEYGTYESLGFGHGVVDKTPELIYGVTREDILEAAKGVFVRENAVSIKLVPEMEQTAAD